PGTPESEIQTVPDRTCATARDRTQSLSCDSSREEQSILSLAMALDLDRRCLAARLRRNNMNPATERQDHRDRGKKIQQFLLSLHQLRVRACARASAWALPLHLL